MGLHHEAATRHEGGVRVNTLNNECSVTSMVQIACCVLYIRCIVICVGGSLLYDSVQLVQNSVALNGSQRVLLDHVLSEEQCAELRNLAHVRTLHDKSLCRFTFGFSICIPFPHWKYFILC